MPKSRCMGELSSPKQATPAKGKRTTKKKGLKLTDRKHSSSKQSNSKVSKGTRSVTAILGDPRCDVGGCPSSNTRESGTEVSSSHRSEGHVAIDDSTGVVHDLGDDLVNERPHSDVSFPA